MKKLILLTNSEKKERFINEINEAKRDFLDGGSLEENQNNIFFSMLSTGKRLEDICYEVAPDVLYDIIDKMKENKLKKQIVSLQEELYMIVCENAQILKYLDKNAGEIYIAYKDLLSIKYTSDCRISPLYEKVKDKVKDIMVENIKNNIIDDNLLFKEFYTIFNVGVTQFIIDIFEENKNKLGKNITELGDEELSQLAEIIKKEKHLIDFGY